MTRSLRYIIMVLPALLALLGCNKVIYDDLSDCPQGVFFTFHVQTKCMSAPTYPSDIKEVRVFAFDENGLLTAEYSAKDLSLSADYRLETDYHRVGKSTFIAWGGSDLSKYNFSQFEIGKTKQNEMLLSLERQSSNVSAFLPPLYVGHPIGGAIEQIDRSKIGTHFDTVDFRMEQMTNLVRLTVVGLEENRKYSVRIEDDNSKYLIGGAFAPDTRFNYFSPNFEQKGRSIKADFSLLKLAHHRNAHLYITDVLSGQVVYDANIVEDLIAYRGEYYPETVDPPFSLECDHIFNIVIQLNNKINTDTYIAFNVYINKWNMVFRVVDLGK